MRDGGKKRKEEQVKEDNKNLLVEAYEAILTQKRMEELAVLNNERFIHCESNRPPEKGWYSIKDERFHKEFAR